MVPPAQAVKWFGYIWAGPNSLLGLMLGIIGCRSSPRRIDGAFLFEGFRLFRPAGLSLTGFTLGHVIITVGPASPALIAHELVHVRQNELWGPFFIPIWIIGLVIGALRTGYAYFGNPLEQEPFLAEGVPIGCPGLAARVKEAIEASKTNKQ